MNEKKNYVSYDYKEVTVRSDQVSFYLDCYENFGWHQEENKNFPAVHSPHMTTLHLKRDRKIINKMELTRLQRHFEACIDEIKALEKSQNTTATLVALSVALLGTAFMTGATFAAVYNPPVIWLCVVLAIPGFAGWILPYFLYQWGVQKKAAQTKPLIEAKYEEIFEICEKGHSLL